MQLQEEYKLLSSRQGPQLSSTYSQMPDTRSALKTHPVKAGLAELGLVLVSWPPRSCSFPHTNLLTKVPAHSELFTVLIFLVHTLSHFFSTLRVPSPNPCSPQSDPPQRPWSPGHLRTISKELPESFHSTPASPSLTSCGKKDTTWTCQE